MDNPTYEDVCRYVGQLFLETRHQLESVANDAANTRREAQQAREERDAALSLLPSGAKPPKGG
jgi:hypothetical protein